MLDRSDSTTIPPLRLTIRQALGALNISRSLLYERIASNKIKTYRDGGRVFVSHAEIARYVAACEAGE